MNGVKKETSHTESSFKEFLLSGVVSKEIQRILVVESRLDAGP